MCLISVEELRHTTFRKNEIDLMQEFLKFWKKDFVNKLILIHTSLLFIGVTALVVFLFRMPEGKSFGGLLGNIFPTPTTEPKVLMTQAAEQAILKMYYATASVPPTITTQPLAELFFTETPLPEGFTVLPTDTPLPSATPFVLPTATPEVVAVPEQATPTASIAGGSDGVAASAGLACLPKGTPQTGRVLDVISGNVLKVLVGEYAYIVQYIGVEAPADAGYGLVSTNTNGSLAFGRDVLLYKDAQDTDPTGIYLRWVVLDGKMPAVALLEQGLLTTYDPAPNSSCFDLLKQAEKKARDSKLGVWAIR